MKEKKLMMYLWLMDYLDIDEERWHTTIMQPWALET